MIHTSSRVSDIKKAQRESILFKLISELFTQAASDDQRLKGIFISRVQLSDNRSLCTVFFYSADGKKHFDDLFEVLKLYKPSMRKAVAKNISARYAADIRFAYDEHFDKVQKLEKLIESVKTTEEE